MYRTYLTRLIVLFNQYARKVTKAQQTSFNQYGYYNAMLAEYKLSNKRIHMLRIRICGFTDNIFFSLYNYLN